MPAIVAPELIVPITELVVIKLPAITAVKLAFAAVNTEAIPAKFARNRQFCIDIPAASTLMVAVVAVLRTNVGRSRPAPRPIIATPAWLRLKAVAEVIVSR